MGVGVGVENGKLTIISVLQAYIRGCLGRECGKTK